MWQVEDFLTASLHYLHRLIIWLIGDTIKLLRKRWSWSWRGMPHSVFGTCGNMPARRTAKLSALLFETGVPHSQRTAQGYAVNYLIFVANPCSFSMRHLAPSKTAIQSMPSCAGAHLPSKVIAAWPSTAFGTCSVTYAATATIKSPSGASVWSQCCSLALYIYLRYLSLM